MSDYEFHPACLSLPKMDRDEYSALRASIRAGYDDLHPILLHDGLILDGRHRYLACIDENVTPEFHNWSGEDPFDFVRRQHEARRSWRSQEQKALVIGTLLDRSEEWAAEKARIQEEANRARSAARAEQGTHNPDGLGGKSGKTADDAGLIVEPHCEVQLSKPTRDTAKMHKQSTATAKAEKIGVSRPAVERAETIKRNSPELAEKVAQGEITAKAAIREIKAEKGILDLADAKKQISDAESRLQAKERFDALLAQNKRPHVSNNAGENEWYTPEEFIDAARQVLGKIDLDPASSEIANKTVKAIKFYSNEDDGLQQEWVGNVWMNPPYEAGLIDKFCQKFQQSIESGNVIEGIVLVNNATETKWFKSLVDCAGAVVFPTRRIRFLSPDGKPGAPLQGQAILYAGNNRQTFLSVFSQFGWGAML